MQAGQTLSTQATRAAVSVALAVTLGHFINDAYGAMLTPLAPAIRSQYGVSIAAVTLLASVFSLTSSVLQPVLGVIGERFDRRLMAAAGPALTGLGLTFMGYAPHFGVLLLLVALAGFGSGFFHPAGAAYTARYSPLHQRGLWASIFSAGGTAGMALGPVFAGVGLHALPVFAPIGLVVGAISFVITPLCARSVRFFSSTSMSLSIFTRQITRQPASGTLPPLKPVPEPRVTTGTLRCRASLTQSATSSAVSGNTTAPGRCFKTAVPSKP